jgi:hypothetical protein
MYLVFNVFYFYSGVGQKDSGVGRAHLAPPFATPLLVGNIFNEKVPIMMLVYSSRYASKAE